MSADTDMVARLLCPLPPGRNRIVLEFSPETGRISKVGAYNDTEVVAAAKRSAAAAAEDD